MVSGADAGSKPGKGECRPERVVARRDVRASQQIHRIGIGRLEDQVATAKLCQAWILHLLLIPSISLRLDALTSHHCLPLYDEAQTTSDVSDYVALRVTVYAITSDLYHYWQTVTSDRYNSMSETGLTEPILIYNNIHDGLGILGSMAGIRQSAS